MTDDDRYVTVAWRSPTDVTVTVDGIDITRALRSISINLAANERPAVALHVIPDEVRVDLDGAVLNIIDPE